MEMLLKLYTIGPQEYVTILIPASRIKKVGQWTSPRVHRSGGSRGGAYGHKRFLKKTVSKKIVCRYHNKHLFYVGT